MHPPISVNGERSLKCPNPSHILPFHKPLFLFKPIQIYNKKFQLFQYFSSKVFIMKFNQYRRVRFCIIYRRNISFIKWRLRTWLGTIIAGCTDKMMAGRGRRGSLWTITSVMEWMQERIDIQVIYLKHMVSFGDNILK